MKTSQILVKTAAKTPRKPESPCFWGSLPVSESPTIAEGFSGQAVGPACFSCTVCICRTNFWIYILIWVLSANIRTWMTRLPFTPSRDTLFSRHLFSTLSSEASLATLSMSFADISSRLLRNIVSGPRPQLSLYNSNEHVSLQIWPKLQIHTLSHLLDISTWCPLAMSSLTGQKKNHQFSSVAQSCLTLCNPMNRSKPGLPVHHQLLESTQTHVHQVGDAIQPSHPLSSPSPPALNLSQHQGLFKWVSSSHQVAKALEFQLQHQSFQWTPRTDLL